MIHNSAEDEIANNYFKNLNGPLSFIIIGIYFSIVNTDHFQKYAIFTSLLLLIYLIFWFKKYDNVAEKYLKRFQGIKKIALILKNTIFLISGTLLLSAAIGLKVFE